METLLRAGFSGEKRQQVRAAMDENRPATVPLELTDGQIARLGKQLIPNGGFALSFPPVRLRIQDGVYDLKLSSLAISERSPKLGYTDLMLFAIYFDFCDGSHFDRRRVIEKLPLDALSARIHNREVESHVYSGLSLPVSAIDPHCEGCSAKNLVAGMGEAIGYPHELLFPF